jgi:hypothetical protein
MVRRAVSFTGLALITLSAAASAQQPTTQAPAVPSRAALPPPAARTGNPTPGTPQPAPPSVADRITLSGCLTLAPGAGAPSASASTSPADNRYVLRDARKDGLVPPETGTSSAASASAAPAYRLEAIESQLSPFVNARIEVSGDVKGAAGAPPVLLVEFVRKLAAKCQ